MIDLKKIDKSWSLFIDRDGVLNHEKKDSYILNWGEYRFYDSVLEAMAVLNEKFDKIVMVTNQKGIGKELMTLDDLNDIHRKMMAAIEANGGRIDRIYFAPDLDSKSYNRKPNPGMAYQAQRDFPGIDFSKSLMVGNKLSDMGFGRNAGIHTVFVATTDPHINLPHPDIDFRFENLFDFAQALIKS